MHGRSIHTARHSTSQHSSSEHPHRTHAAGARLKEQTGSQQVALSPPAVLHAGLLHQGCLGWGQHTQAAHHGTAGTGARQSHHCRSTSGRLWTGEAPQPAHKAASTQERQPWQARVGQDSSAQAHECVWRLHRRSSLATTGGCLGAVHATVPEALSVPDWLGY